MPPIPIHKNAPIKPDGISPKTASPPQPTPTTPASTPATTTTSSSSSSSLSAYQNSPPPPQPGARPQPPPPPTQTHNASSPSTSTITPPTPQPQHHTAHHISTETSITAAPAPAPAQPTPTPRLPPQFSHAAPVDSGVAGRSTVASSTGSAIGGNQAGPTTLNYGLVASPFQRLGEEAEAEEGGYAAVTGSGSGSGTRSSLEHPPGYRQALDHAPYTSGGGIGVEESENHGDGVGAAAWNLLSKAGEALKKGEEAAWKAVRNK